MDKYTEKKLKNQRFQKLIKNYVSKDAFALIHECGTFLAMVADKSLEHKKLHKANFCKNRFCPMCAWRKARKDAFDLSLMMTYLREKEKKSFIFLTLTTPNVKSDHLENEIKKFNHAFRKMMKRKRLENVVRGYVRKLELTYNKERDDYHPHFHVFIAVDKSYFKKPHLYMTRKEWLYLWQDVTGMPEITQVDVQRVVTDNKKDILEMSKYLGKDSDYLSEQKVFDVFYSVLKGKQLLVYSGLFKEARKKLENGELDYLKEKDMNEYIYLIFYLWKKKKYLEGEKFLLSESEKAIVNKNLINEYDDE